MDKYVLVATKGLVYEISQILYHMLFIQQTMVHHQTIQQNQHISDQYKKFGLEPDSSICACVSAW